MSKLWLLSARITKALAPRRGREPVRSGSSKMSASAVKPTPSRCAPPILTDRLVRARP